MNTKNSEPAPYSPAPEEGVTENLYKFQDLIGPDNLLKAVIAGRSESFLRKTLKWTSDPTEKQAAGNALVQLLSNFYLESAQHNSNISEAMQDTRRFVTHSINGGWQPDATIQSLSQPPIASPTI
ncbi:MAG: hypothetical protein WCT01_00630 [Candidatus Shapirobacteria bacterium]